VVSDIVRSGSSPPELVLKTLKAAQDRWHLPADVIFHSDRGSQFTSYAFRESLSRYGALQSMSGTGRCYDNARMESFFATLKKEKLYRLRTDQYPMAYVKTVIFRYIMIYYNRQRIYTSNPGGWPPTVYRERQLGQMVA
jgi:transposase InsO family protein